ncbi:MAG: GAF domain-containing protein [Planctomycetota bacterium]|nr:MAG: GAF domain-containing protein [Planctomycetota bacterium]
MPRLIMIEGPRSGDSFRLGHENYVGYRGGVLSFSHRQDVGQVCCAIYGGGERFELLNHGQPNRILLNGEAVRQAVLHHGDLISVDNSLMIFDSDESEGSDSSRIGVGIGTGFGPSTVPPPYAAPQGRPHSMRLGAIVPGEASDMMLGTVSIRREDLAKENINYRQKAYENQDAVLRGIGDKHRIHTLFKVTSKISTILDLQQLLDELLALIFDELPADRGSILLFDAQKRRLRTMTSRSRAGGRVKVKISKTIVKEVIRTRESLLTADAQSDRRLDMAMSIVDENIRSALCVPLVRGERILGIIFLDTYDSQRQFTSDDCDLLTAIAMQAAMALENARLVKEMGDRERLRHELSLAATIQKQLLPRKLPRSQLIEVYGKMIPAKEMSGDYFDFIDHDGGNFHIAIGDVSGKGLPAGLVMIMARSYLRPLSKSGLSPRQILAEANRLLYADTRKDMFMSALVLYWSDQTGKFVWSGAGHEHLLVYRARTRRVETLKAGGCVLAAVPNADHLFVDHELHLEPGDSLVLYTDGVTEAKNARDEFFAQDSLQPLERLVELYGNLSAKDLLEAVLWELKQYIGSAEQADDITVVTVKRPAAG